MSAALRDDPRRGPRLASAPRGDRGLGGLRWRPLGPLGSGGMGAVYEVEHVDLGRRAALKVLHEDHAGNEEHAARLRDEARALARLRHRAIPDVLDLGALADGRPFFVMQLFRGRDLRRELGRLGVVAVPTAIRWMAEVLDALEVVHDAGLVHRDVKLENLLIDDAGAPALVDFGVALDVEATLRHTGRGRLVGTPRTMSPEQHAAIDVDHRADLYAVGLCLFELVAGTGPFDVGRPTTVSMLHAHCRRSPPRVGDLAPQPIPHALEEVIARALAKSPDERFASATEMRAALLAAAARGPVRVAPASPPPGGRFPPTLESPRPGADSLRAVLAELADEPATSSTFVLSSAAARSTASGL